MPMVSRKVCGPLMTKPSTRSKICVTSMSLLTNPACKHKSEIIAARLDVPSLPSTQCPVCQSPPSDHIAVKSGQNGKGRASHVQTNICVTIDDLDHCACA